MIALEPPPPRFDARRLEEPGGVVERFLMWLAPYPRLQNLMDLARWWTPAIRLGDTTIVLRHDDVRRVLGDSESFPVPWGPKMEWVTGTNFPLPFKGGKASQCGRNFVLGMKDRSRPYDGDYRLLAHAFHEDDVQKVVGELATKATQECLGKLGVGEDDLIEKVITAVPTMLCGTYYGLQLPEDLNTFAKCTLAVSSFVFGEDFDALDNSVCDERMQLAKDAAPHIQHAIWSSIANARNGHGQQSSPLDRLLQQTSRRGDKANRIIHSQFFGMVLGFIPTNVLAGGNILETLLRQPAFMAKVVEAVDAGDDVLLWRCLRETLRFRNINFGPLRRCAQDTLLQAEGGEWKIRKGDKVLASTQSAMFDRRRIQHPHEFDSGRPEQDYLSFGVGQHWCLGAYIAQAQLTATFRELLKAYRLRPLRGREGAMKRFRVFPLHMRVALEER